MNIIIKTPNFIGDTIMMLGAFELLKIEYPNALFTIITPKQCVDIFRKKGIAKIIVDDTKSHKGKRLSKTFILIKEIRKEHYDLGFVFHNTLLDAVVFKISHIDKTLGYNKENSKFFLDYWMNIDRTRHYINHYVYLVNSFLNQKYKKLPSISLHSTKSTLINYDIRNVGFVLGGENKGTRSYPVQLSLELFTLLHKDKINIILLGDISDNRNNSIYENHLEKLNTKSINLSGKTSIGEFIDVISSIDLLVTIDSSAMHIAASVNTKFITLVGKGTSVFEIVKPKVNFGTYLKKDILDIEDSQLIANIEPELIRRKIIEECG